MSKNIINDELKNQFAKKYLAYALSTITQRALPDVRDGLKPVHRRLIYAMYLLNLSPKSQFKKSARVVGDVIGKFHPHGDQSVYDALVRLAQDFVTKYPLINGQGNFGNIDGDNAAAMRYTETKLTATSQFLLKNIEEETVEFKKTYDGELEEPEILPSQFPNILANGSSGIAVGMATSIPPHNVHEICDAIIYLNNNPKATVRNLLKFIQGPDFPTGGILNDDKKEIYKAYNTGRGYFEIKSKYNIEDLGKGSYQIAITEIPYSVNKSKLIEKIAEIIINKKNKLLNHVSDESDEKIRIVLRPKSRNISPQDLMNSLFEQTELKNKFFLNMNVLNSRKEPKVMNLKEVLNSLLNHRYVILNRRINYRLNKIKVRLEILRGFLIVFNDLDKIIKIIRSSRDPKKELVIKFRLSFLQVDAILEMRLRNLKKIEENEIRKEFKNLESEKKRLNKIIKSNALQRNEINQEYKEIINEFGNDTVYGKRKSIKKEFENFTSNDLKSKLKVIENINISLISKQFLKVKKGHYKYSELSDDKNINLIMNCKSTDKIILLSNFGKSYTLDCATLKFGPIKGISISQYVKLVDKEEIIDAFVFVTNIKIILSTKKGYGYIIKSDDLVGSKKSGKKIFLNHANDELYTSCAINEKIDRFVSIFLSEGKKLKLLIFKLKEIPSFKKSSGVLLYKAKGFNTFCINCINKNLIYYDSNNKKINISKKIKSYVSKKGKQGKSIKISNTRHLIFRGYQDNYKFYD